MIDILIADDHELFRRGLAAIIERETDMRVVGEAENSYEVLDRLDDSKASVVLLDLAMPGRGGVEVARDIKQRKAGVAVLIVSAHPEDHYAVRCLRNGADGYLVKSSHTEVLLEAIRRVATGRKYISANLAEKLAVTLDDYSDGEPHVKLSDREFEVLRMIGAGLTVSEIASDLCLSVKTVSTYRARILEKLTLENNSQIMRYAMDHGLA